jgi:hypothetical protein
LDNLLDAPVFKGGFILPGVGPATDKPKPRSTSRVN